jgi:lipopolysaccharide export system permease protein
MDIYVTKLFVKSYAICFLSFLGLFVTMEAFAKLDRFLRQEGVLVSIVRYHMAMIPTTYANHMGPLLTLAAAMFTMTLLHKQNELTPLKASGVSIYRVMLPIFILAALLAAATFYLKDQALPRFKDPIRAALSLSRSRPLNPPPYKDSTTGALILVREYSPTRKVGNAVQVIYLHPNGKVREQIDAHQLEWLPASGNGTVEPAEEGSWRLLDGSVQRSDEYGNLVVNASASSFERLKAPFKQRTLETSLRPIDLESSDQEISYLSWKELRTQYQRQPYHRHLAVKLHHHFAFPMSHIVLLLLGVPFVLRTGTRSAFLSIAMSILICGLFFLTSSICMSVANHPSEILSATLAAWLPVMLFGALGMTFFDRLPT